MRLTLDQNGHYTAPSTDPGIFIKDWQTHDLEAESNRGVYQFTNPRTNKPITFQSCRYFILVGGGYRGFKSIIEAKRVYRYGH